MTDLELRYLQWSADIYDSLELTQEHIDRIWDAPGKAFTSLGYVTCGAMGVELPIGIKKRSLTNKRALHEHTLAALLETSESGIAHTSLPEFVIGLTYGNLPVGILTEDFTENGTVVLEEETFSLPPMVIKDDMPTPLHGVVFDVLQGGAYAEAMQHMTGLVAGRRVLVDFDDVGCDFVEPYRSAYNLVAAQQEKILRPLE